MKWDEGIGGGQRGTERGGGGGRKAEKEGCEGRVGCEVLSQFWSWIHCLTNMWSEFCFEAKERRDYTVVLNTQVTHRMDAHSLHTWLLARSLGGFGVAWTSFLSRGCCWVVLGNPGPWDPVLDSYQGDQPPVLWDFGRGHPIRGVPPSPAGMVVWISSTCVVSGLWYSWGLQIFKCISIKLSMFFKT